MCACLCACQSLTLCILIAKIFCNILQLCLNHFIGYFSLSPLVLSGTSYQFVNFTSTQSIAYNTGDAARWNWRHGQDAPTVWDSRHKLENQFNGKPNGSLW